jgi:hypothetical protein
MSKRIFQKQGFDRQDLRASFPAIFRYKVTAADTEPVLLLPNGSSHAKLRSEELPAKDLIGRRFWIRSSLLRLADDGAGRAGLAKW